MSGRIWSRPSTWPSRWRHRATRSSTSATRGRRSPGSGSSGWSPSSAPCSTCCSASTASAAGRGRCAGRPHPKPPPNPFECAASELPQVLGPAARHLAALAQVVAGVTGRPLLRGNRITPLHNGDEAYPAMLRAIDEARDSVLLSTYIFDNDRAGGAFVERPGRAVARGVEVRVLIDDIGARYTWPSIVGRLRRRGRAGRPVPADADRRGWFPYANLRNHRKILVVDGRVGFTGGMNIREGHLLRLEPAAPDARPALPGRGPGGGPPAGGLRRRLGLHHRRAPARASAGSRRSSRPATVLARGIADGPDEDFETAAHDVSSARSPAPGPRSSIVTPYFLPDAPLISALNVAAMRGVEVDILLPAREQPEAGPVGLDGAAVAGAGARLPRVALAAAVRPHQADGRGRGLDAPRLGQLGPAQPAAELRVQPGVLRPRARRVAPAVVRDERLRDARPVTLAEVDGRSLPVKLRDGLARLLSPYL